MRRSSSVEIKITDFKIIPVKHTNNNDIALQELFSISIIGSRFARSHNIKLHRESRKCVGMGPDRVFLGKSIAYLFSLFSYGNLNHEIRFM